MGISVNYHHSSFARSLSYIHLNHAEEWDGNDISATSKEKRASASISPKSRRSITPPLSWISDEKPPSLPFSTDGQPSFTSDRTFRRRSSKQRRRRATVTFAPSIIVNQQEHLYDANDCNNELQEEQEHRKGWSQAYSLGDTIQSISHIIIESTSESAILGVNTLQNHDFAFVRRSDGSYTYAILAFRSYDSIKGECMTFVMNDSGATKSISQKHWSNNIHLLSRDLDPVHRPTVALGTLQEPLPVVLCQEIPVLCEQCEPVESNMNDLFVPPQMISFVSEMDYDEECSLMSSVSDRA